MTVESNMTPVPEGQTPAQAPWRKRLAALWDRTGAVRAHPAVVSAYGWGRSHAVPLCLILILLVGAIFRFTGVNWDMSQHFHPDERFIWMVELALNIPKSVAQYFNTAQSPLNPYNSGSSFVYGTLPLFMVKFLGEMLNVGGDSIHLLGRVMAGLFDLVTILFMFLIGRKLYGTRVGLLTAFLCACLVLSIQQAHFFTMDSFAATFVVATFYYSLWVAERGQWRDFLAMGASFGAAVACRINVALVALVMGLACLLRIYNALTAPAAETEAAPGMAEAPAMVTAAAPAGVAAQGGLPEAPRRTGWERTLGGVRIAFHVEPNVSYQEALVPALAAATVAGETADLPGEVAPDASGMGEAALAVHSELPRPPEQKERNWLEVGFTVALRGVVCLLLAFLVFRITQPYTFQGPGFFDIKLASNWLADMRNWSPILSGKADSYPSHQWASRPAVLYSWVNMVLWMVGLPMGLAGWAGWWVAWYELLRKRVLPHLLPLAWTTFSFFYHSVQFIKNPRYLAPTYPFFALLAAWLVVELWKRARSASFRRAKPLATALVLVVAVGTFLWAFAFTRIYTRPHTWVAASRWIYQNIPAGSALTGEAWSDWLPWGGVDGRNGFADGTYKSVEMHPYAEDTPEKLGWFMDWLNQADYVILSCNRLYASIPRIPMRYPMTTRYYNYLFNGELGFELIKTITSRPNLGPIEFVDDNADESYTVYDHPKALIFKKTAQYSSDRAYHLLSDGVDFDKIAHILPIQVPQWNNGLQLSDTEKAAQQTGGTWSDIFNRKSLSNALPVLIWLLLVELVGVVTLPLAYVLFHSLSDRGYIFSKTLGILLLSWITWIAVSLGLTGFSRVAIAAGVLLLTACGAILFWRKREEMLAFWQEHRALVVINEVLFLLFFLGFLLIRYGNPDLWHPIMGGEKPMDFAYLNAVIRSSTFPPYDPWFAGGYLNYYYFGQIILAVLIKFTGIVPWVAYNLSIPLLAALTAMGAFSVVYNLTAKKARTQPSSAAGSGGGDEVSVQAGPLPWVMGRLSFVIHSWEPAMTWALLAALMVAVLGNLAEIAVPLRALYELGTTTIQSSIPFVIAAARVLSGLSRVLTGKAQLGIRPEWPYWNPSRVMPNGEINEFPLFTFLYADLHAHLIALPFTLLALGLAVAAIKKQRAASSKQAAESRKQKAESDQPYTGAHWLPGVSPSLGRWLTAGCSLLQRVDWGEVLLLGAMGLVVGALRPTNSWDYPTYLLIVGVALLLREYESRKKIDIDLLVAVAWRSMVVFGLSYILFWPFLSHFSTAYTSFERWKGLRSGLGNYLGIHGLFLFVIISWMGVELFSREVREGTVRMLQLSVRYWDRLPRLLGAYNRLVKKGRQYDSLGWVIVAPLALVALGLALTRQWFFLFIWLLILGTLLIVLRLRLEVGQRFLWLLFALGLVLSLAVDLFVLKGDIGRMNTVFKFYLQIWVLWSVVTAVGLSYLFDRLRRWSPSRRGIWQGVLALLLVLAALYPILATKAKISDRFDATLGPSLDGTAYMQTATYNDGGQVIELKYDLEAINWLLDNVTGSPVIAEANTEPRGLYRWGSRVAIYTGMPTIIGWSWHQRQQRSAMPSQWIDQRLNDVQRLYSDNDPGVALEIVRKYDVRYIYVGEVERIYYPQSGLDKFERMRADGQLKLVHENPQVRIYEVKAE